jgi:SPP1 family phage portal protein
MAIQLPLGAAQITAFHTKLRRRRGGFEENRLYSEGKNPHIREMSPRRDPDNRLALPFAKMAVSDMVGYAGRAGDRTIEVDNVTTDATTAEDAAQDDFIQHIRTVYDFNETDRETSELYAEALVQGEAYELVWTGEELPGAGFMAEYAMLPTAEVVMVYSDELKKRAEAALWFHEATRADGTPDLVCDAFYPGESQRWRAAGTGGWERAPDGDREYPFTSVPVVAYPINRQRTSFFEAEKGLLFAQDKLLSSSVNEVDRFNALIALFPFLVDDEFKDKLRDMNVIDDLGDYEQWPQYLEKNLTAVEGFYNSLADRLERLFHKSIKVPDFSDENFAGNSSGVALAYKLIAMEFVAAQIDAYFDRGVERRYELIAEAINAGARTWPTEDYELIISNKRNLPVDEATKVDIAQKLVGIVSEETLLRMLPSTIVEDVERELARIAEGPAMTLGEEEEPGTELTTTEEPDKVQDLALNGAQVTALADIVERVGTGAMPPSTAIQLLLVAFPAITPEQAAAIINPAAANPTPPPITTGSEGFGTT